MAQCQSPEELMKLISRIVDAMVNQYLLCGTLQGGLVACGEDSYLPKDTEVVLCRQLHELVQEGIDTGKIVAPTVVEVRYEGSTLILHLADGENLTLDLKPLIDGVIDQAFTDCDGQSIHVGTALATCANLEAANLASSANLAALEQKVDHNKELTDQADSALNQRIDDWITDTTERMTLLDESITNKIDAATAEWANTVLQQLIEQFLETRQVYHDDSLDGNGHEAAPLKVDVTWLRNQITAHLPEVVKFTDCCGNDIAIGDVLVTCACLETQLTSLVNELKAYAEQQAADVLIEANNYTDAKAADTLQQANNYTDAKAADTLQQANNYTDDKISNINIDIPYLRNALATGIKPLVSVDGLGLGYSSKASSTGTTALGNTATASGAYATAVGQATKAIGGGSTAVGFNAEASGSESTAIGRDALAKGPDTTAIGRGASASGVGSTALGHSAVVSDVNSTALGYGAKASSAFTTAVAQGAVASGVGATAVGRNAAASNSGATAIGQDARASGAYATALGQSASASGSNATALGQSANASGLEATALGFNAIANYDLTTALGYRARVTGANQLQLGDSATTTYAYGAVQDRSDKRDKTDVHNSDLGLEFIRKLRPVKYRLDYRDDYINELFHKPKREDFIDESAVNEADYLVEITDVVREPNEPDLSEADFESTESYKLVRQAVHTRNLERQAKYEEALQARREEQLANLAQAKSLVREQQEAAYAQALQAYQAECYAFMQNPDKRKDGSKARQRYHYGLIADELKSTMDELGVDFGGYQDHGINGGMCVKSVGYTELISPLIKAVQELSAQVDDLKQQLKGTQSRTSTISTKGKQTP